MKNRIFLALVVSLSIMGCGIISFKIEGVHIDLDNLTTIENAYFLSGSDSLFKSKALAKVLLMNGKQLASYINSADTVILINWNPSCKGEICTNLSYYENMGPFKNYKKVYVLSDLSMPNTIANVTQYPFSRFVIPDVYFYKTFKRKALYSYFYSDLLDKKIGSSKDDTYAKYIVLYKSQVVFSFDKI